MEQKSVTCHDGAQISYQVSRGKRPEWIVFLHGLGGDLMAWKPLERHFIEQGFSTLVMDIRGHGLSGRSSSPDFYSFENMANDVFEIVKTEQMDKVILVGHCFGGMVSIHVGARQPDFLNGLVLIDAGYEVPFVSRWPRSKTVVQKLLTGLAVVAPSMKAEGYGNHEKYIGSSAIHLRRLWSEMTHTSLKSYILLFKMVVGYDAEKLLHEIKIPTLVLHGTDDGIFPPKVAERMKEKIEQAELRFMDGVNHISVINDPDKVQEGVAAFVEKIYS